MSLLWIIDDEPVICSTLKRTFENQGHRVRIFSAAEPAIAEASRIASQNFRHDFPELVVIDVRLPGIDGLTALRQLDDFFPEIPMIVMTAFGDLPTAIRAMEAKVFEYLTKPFDLDAAILAVERGLASRAPFRRAEGVLAMSVEEKMSNNPLLDKTDFELLGTSPAMQTVFKRIAMAATTDCPVLICGESGTGKELVARAIHRHSLRQNEPYLAVAPVTLNPTLIESELFGHERGAFTGAEQARRGVFELAGQGTILLDEIGDLPLAQQVKLLRVLEQREYFPVGSSKPRDLKARVIAATHRELKKRISDGTFREDLFFRLAVFTIEVPPLRDRPCDIVPLALSFLRRQGYPDNADVIAPEAVHLLHAYAWPGNVRELRNAIDQATVLARGNRIHSEHLPGILETVTIEKSLHPDSLASRFEQLVRSWVAEQQLAEGDAIAGLAPSTADFDESTVVDSLPNSLYVEFLSLVEPPLLRALLDSSQGNRAAVAQKLGLHRSTLRQKMRNYQMET